MQRVLGLVVAAVLLTAAANVQADEGQISGKDLQALGIPGLQVMSEAEGHQIRGMANPALSVAFANFVRSLGTGPTFGFPVTNNVIAGGFSLAR